MKNVLCEGDSQRAQYGGVRVQHGQKELPYMLYSGATSHTGCFKNDHLLQAESPKHGE